MPLENGAAAFATASAFQQSRPRGLHAYRPTHTLYLLKLRSGGYYEDGTRDNVLVYMYATEAVSSGSQAGRAARVCRAVACPQLAWTCEVTLRATVLRETGVETVATTGRPGPTSPGTSAAPTTPVRAPFQDLPPTPEGAAGDSVAAVPESQASGTTLSLPGAEQLNCIYAAHVRFSAVLCRDR